MEACKCKKGKCDCLRIIEGTQVKIEKPETNFTWTIGDGTCDMSFNFFEKRTLFNRFKWWLGTKICIPGNYIWNEVN